MKFFKYILCFLFLICSFYEGSAAHDPHQQCFLTLSPASLGLIGNLVNPIVDPLINPHHPPAPAVLPPGGDPVAHINDPAGPPVAPPLPGLDPMPRLERIRQERKIPYLGIANPEPQDRLNLPPHISLLPGIRANRADVVAFLNGLRTNRYALRPTEVRPLGRYVVLMCELVNRGLPPPEFAQARQRMEAIIGDNPHISIAQFTHVRTQTDPIPTETLPGAIRIHPVGAIARKLAKVLTDRNVIYHNNVHRYEDLVIRNLSELLHGLTMRNFPLQEKAKGKPNRKDPISLDASQFSFTHLNNPATMKKIEKFHKDIGTPRELRKFSPSAIRNIIRHAETTIGNRRIITPQNREILQQNLETLLTGLLSMYDQDTLEEIAGRYRGHPFFTVAPPNLLAQLQASPNLAAVLAQDLTLGNPPIRCVGF